MSMGRRSRNARSESASPRSLRLSPKQLACRDEAEDARDAIVIQDRCKQSGIRVLQPGFELAQDPRECFMRRTQLLSAFFEAHYPSRQNKTSLVTRGSALKLLPSVDVAHPLLGPAIEAVCLSFFAQQSDDPSIAHYATALYGQTLASIHRELTRSKYKPSDVVHAILLITLYRERPSKAKQDSNTWTAHYLGATTYIASRTSSDFDMESELDRCQFRTLRCPSWFIAVAKRKAVPLDALEELKWLKPQSHDPMKSLYRYMVALPGVLERADSLTDGSPSERDIESICAEIEDLRYQLARWYQSEIDLGASSLKPSCLYVEKMDTEDWNPIVCVMATHSALNYHYYFSGNMSRAYRTYNKLLIMLDLTLLRLAHFFPNSPAVIHYRPLSDIQQDAHTRAMDLCRCIYALCRTDSMALVGYMQLLVELAHNFFMETGAATELGWCQSVLLAIDLRLQEMRATQPPPLCRIWDVISGISSAGHYRARRVGLHANVQAG